jgi:uncharacterized protein involved in propanediol utilization
MTIKSSSRKKQQNAMERMEEARRTQAHYLAGHGAGDSDHRAQNQLADRALREVASAAEGW